MLDSHLNVHPSIQVCRPKTSCHRRSLKWMSSLTQLAEPIGEQDPTLASERHQSLQHSMQFYSIYVETGDERYLSMCEDFLRQLLEG